jgi:hypothetical protein
MGHHGNSCKEKSKVCIEDSCGRKMKAKITKDKSIGANRSVTAGQVLTSTTTTVLQLTTGNFSFSNCSGCKSCCSPCGYNTYNANFNNICLSCKGLYNVTALVTLDVAPGTDVVTLALDVNNQQVIAVPLTGSSTTISFSTNLNLCSSSTVQFRIYQSPITVAVTVTGGMVSVAKVGGFVC